MTKFYSVEFLIWLKKSFLVKHSGPTKKIDMEAVFFQMFEFQTKIKNFLPLLKKNHTFKMGLQAA